MANAHQTRPANARHILRCSLLLLLCLGTPALRAEIISDLLIVLESDGRHYVAQHTLASDGELVVAQLPAAREPLATRFAGAERLTFASAHEHNPDQLSLWSGSAWTRYRHRYEEGLSESDPGEFELQTRLEHADIGIDEPAVVQWSLTWVLPDTARFTDFGTIAAPASAATSSSQESLGSAKGWQNSGQVLTYRQSGGQLPALRIQYSLNPADSVDTDACLDAPQDDDRCAPDTDGDAVPDFRDICLPPSSDVSALLPPRSDAARTSGDFRAQQLAESLGCAPDDPLVLPGVHFQSGQYYLDVASRLVLDRVAHALQRVPEQRVEISSHTDNAGRVESNQSLSDERAQAVRHYLVLRGVQAGQLTSRGHGEIVPVYDNAMAAGRRANRRTELHLLD